ncbi:MAG: NAD(P)-dependent oxidoreductase, partial [Candidatus Omnitrophica bacterium]|nr:NAD(P)-dependent oxidoreductase [Candidatus Omnitrophota bacterium]
LRLMRELASEVNTALPVTNAVEQLFAQSEAAGKGELDYSAILSYLEHQH